MFRKTFHSLAIVTALACAQAGCAQGDLLVAPTRLVLAPQQGGEVVVSNSGSRTSSYRISLVVRRMDERGQINNVEEGSATAAETATVEMVNYAPRKITLAPGQSQTVRIGVRAPADLAAGEYRAHLLFRAIPDATPQGGDAAPADGGMSISLTPIYGVAIPVIVRIGDVPGGARMVSARLETVEGQQGVMIDLAREGQRSIYGTLSLNTPSELKPLAQVKGLAVYPELNHRQVFVPVDPKLLGAKPVLTARFVETDASGKSVTAELPVN